MLVHSQRPIGSLIEGLLLVWISWTENDLRNKARGCRSLSLNGRWTSREKVRLPGCAQRFILGIVRQEMPPSVIVSVGFAVQLLGTLAAYQYVTTGRSSAAFVWVPAGLGWVLTILGLAMMYRQTTTTGKRLRLAGKLLAVGILSFLVVALGHAFAVFFLIAIPALVFAIVISLIAAATAFVSKLRHRHARAA